MTNTHDTVTQALPMPSAGPQMRMVEIALIEESLTNPRKQFDQAKLQELADSIAATGIHTPILLRPLPGNRVPETWGFRRQGSALPAYELVCGARRLRASKIAKAKEIPAMIREMTDAQALEAQVIENLQREDISKLEEAEGYRALMQEAGMSADEIGAKVGKGKSRSYIYGVLKILDLCEAGRDALRQGKLDFSCALPLARIPVQQLQAKALERALNGDWNGPMKAREVKRMVRNDYMLDLKQAVFDRTDANLCPSAGTCTDCPHRTGANPDLFTDVDSADVCTNPPCYHAKEDAHSANVRKQAKDIGCEVIDGREAKALMPYSFSEVKGYLRLDSPSDSPVKGKTLRKLVHKAMETADIKPTMVVNPHSDKGEMIAVVSPEQAAELLKIAGKAEAHKQQQEENERANREAAATAKKEATEAYERAWRREVARSVVVHAKEPSDSVLIVAARLATQYLVGTLNGDDAKDLCKMLDLGKVAPKDAVRDLATEWASPIALAGAILALRDKEYSPWYWEHNPEAPRNPSLMAMAEACGVDVEAVKAETKANMRAAAAAEKAATTAKKSEAPEGDLPLQPAARAGGGAARSKKGAGKGSAVVANEVPKTSAAHASAQIAEALQELQESGAAAAAQGVEGAPVADAQAPTSGADAQGDDAAPVDAVASQDLPPSSTAAVDEQSEDDGKQQPAAATRQWTAEELVAERVQIRETATGKQQKPWIGYEGTVVAQMGPESVDVSIVRAPRCKPIRVAFHVSEVEVIQ